MARKQRDAMLQASIEGYLHLHNISNSTHLQEQLSEDQHLQILQQGSSSTSQTVTLQSTPDTNNQPSISPHPTTSYCTTPTLYNVTRYNTISPNNVIYCNTISSYNVT